ncbi:MAG: hypothetical protein KGJ10_03940 [Acidobacteriota bacterium]|nr:hypothetical protein [Acidobacteriota bacterium]MDE3043958.1 hypothetical protein [Acidobacteriota bacterium]MDE3107038.1 hypothetical protein [Acidobacteriota bacterium]
MNDTSTLDARHALWTLVWFAVMSVGINTWSSWSQWSGYAIVAPLVTLIGAVGVVAVWVVPPSKRTQLEHLAFVVALGTVIVAYAPAMLAERFFNTDAAAFNQRAVWLLAHGRNPYQAVFHGANLALSYAPNFWTYLLNGGHVDQFSYPAGAFILQWPLQVLGVTHLATNWLDLAAWLAASILLYRLAPPSVNWLAPLLLLTSVFTFSFAHGGTDALFVPFLLVAAYRWDDFVRVPAGTWSRWLSPVALGLACSIKQTPWFAVPFFLLGIAQEARLASYPVARSVARYVAWVALPFVVVNLPFALLSPGAWWRGMTLPLREPLIPDGQGLVTLVTHGVASTLHLAPLQIGAALAVVTLLVVTWRWYPVMKHAWLFALPLVLYLPSRSLSSYLVDFIPAAFVASLTTRAVAVPPPARRTSAWLALGTFGLSLAFIVSAFVGAPLSVRVDHVNVTRVGLRFTRIELTLVNHTSGAVRPHVLVVVGSSHPVGFWTFVGHPGGVLLAPHAHERFWLRAPAEAYAPARHENWLVEVTSASPAFIVTTPARQWRRGPDRSLSDAHALASPSSALESGARVRG